MAWKIRRSGDPANMSQTAAKFDASHFQRTFRRFVQVAKKDAHTELRVQARGFIKELIGITPPGIVGRSAALAKKIGENEIVSNITQLMVGVTLEGKTGKNRLDTRTQLTAEELYLRFRNPSSHSGRVNPRNLGHPYFLPAHEVNALLRRLIDRVGILMSGWSAAAIALGANVPAWVKRHGTSNGAIHVVINFQGMKITMINNIRFADNVQGLEKRIQFALTRQASKMENQMKAILTKAGEKAGFKK
jgi:hypothetical protein